MTPIFNVADQSTWPLVMSIAEVSEVYRRSVPAIRNDCNVNRFVPAAFLNRPYRWRKADVVRHCEGARGSALRMAR